MNTTPQPALLPPLVDGDGDGVLPSTPEVRVLEKFTSFSRTALEIARETPLVRLAEIYNQTASKTSAS